MATKKPAKRAAAKKATAKPYRVRVPKGKELSDLIAKHPMTPAADAAVEQAFGTIQGNFSVEARGQQSWPFATQMNLAKWQSSEAATRPGLYLVRGHEETYISARLELHDDGANKSLAFFYRDGSEAKSHCIKSVYGPIEEPE